MQLKSLFSRDDIIIQGRGEIEIASLTADSRAVRPGDLFFALAGSKQDGARYIADALARGAAAVCIDDASRVTIAPDRAVVQSPDPRRALALAAASLYARQPACTVAVTGTSGKTSTAEFTRQIFASLGHSAASLGTIGIVKPGGSVYGSLTTPDPVALHASLAGLAGEGVTHLALEASSHGLDQRRLDGVRLAAGAFTNLGHDHLDYHADMDAYLRAKIRLFDSLLAPGQPAVVNADGERAGDVIEAINARGLPLFTTGALGETLRLAGLVRSGFTQHLTVAHSGRTQTVNLKVLGDYQASNALLAAGLAIATGARPEDAVAAISTVRGVKGRLELVGGHRGGLIVIDYAHKPEALAAALDALRAFASSRLICVFGCGGDRDRQKRPVMGRIAARKADVVIVTDDNPRSELPEAIRASILSAAAGAHEIADRGEAIRAGIGMLGLGDVLLIAGKGHETGQIIGEEVIPFSDHEVIEEALGGGARGAANG